MELVESSTSKKSLLVQTEGNRKTKRMTDLYNYDVIINSMHHTYILRCSDDTLYVGCTNNIEKRLHEHNHAKAGAHYTKIRRPVVLVYSEKHRTLSKARSREAALKRLSRTQKLQLLKNKLG